MRAFLCSLFLGLLLFSPGVAAAQNPTPTPAPENKQVVKNQVEKTYCALAVGAETVQALKDDLLLKAKRMAVNELFGEMITAVTETEDFVVTRDQVRALSTGYVRIRSSRYFNGENFAEACVTIQVYVTDEDRAQFRPVQLEKRYCGTDPNMTVAQIRAHTQEEAIVQLLSEYDRRLAEVDRNILLRLLRRVQYPESGFVPGTESYCVTVRGEVIPVEVLALLEGETGAVAAATDTVPSRSTRTPRPTPTPANASSATREPQTLTPSVESPHPYPNDYNEIWVISNKDASAQATRLHFARLELEENVDRLILMDAREAEIQRLTGFYPDGVWSEPVPGNLVKIRLITDKSVRHWGFVIDALESVPYKSLAYSPHPYPNHANLEWRFDNLDPDAKGTRLHFSRVELEENGDWLVIMDIKETPYQWITGDHPDGLWTIGVPGNGVTVRLISDGSVRKWGFNIDALESTEPDDPLPKPLSKTVVESPHPYADKYDEKVLTWTLVNPNPTAASTKIHFEKIELGYDTLTLMDGYDRPMQSFSGVANLFTKRSWTNIWSDDIPGRIVKIQLVTTAGHPNTGGWGFRVDQLVDGENTPSLAESPHPYADQYDDKVLTWTLVNPNPTAASTKIHFEKIELGYDTLTLMDGNDRPIQIFSGVPNLFTKRSWTNIWSDDIPGRVVKIQLVTTAGHPNTGGWGFRVDQLADGEGGPPSMDSAP